MLSHVQHLGFFTILISASVPEPLFDLAGITCGQFLVPLRNFFTATLIGKALIKIHIQTVFIILSCNLHLVGLVGHGYVPSLCFVVPRILSALESEKLDSVNQSNLVIQNFLSLLSGTLLCC